MRSSLDIRQDGGFARSVRADYVTRGLDSPLYYVLRAGRWREARAWEVSLVHHKLYLENPPAGVQRLNISHGFNMLSANRAFRQGDWTWRVGAGPVVTHAEALIRGVEYHGPYKVAGVAIVGGVGRRFYVSERTYLAAETAASVAYAKPDLGGAQLTVRNVAVHALVGLGFDM